MRTYSYCKMIVDGKATATLDIYAEHNIFQAYEYQQNVFAGSYSGLISFLKEWRAKWQDVINLLKANGHKVKWDQNIWEEGVNA